MTGNRYHASTDPVSLLADPVVRPDRDVLRYYRGGVDARLVGDADFVAEPNGDGTDGRAAVTPADVSRAQVRALSARIDHLESKLERAERRRLATIDRYEYLLERRTETFRSWVAEDDPRADEFEWIGREVDAGDPVEGPAVGTRTGTAVATDGGRVREATVDDGGIFGRVVGRLRALFS